jgi:hypothetical protein
MQAVCAFVLHQNLHLFTKVNSHASWLRASLCEQEIAKAPGTCVNR